MIELGYTMSGVQKRLLIRRHCRPLVTPRISKGAVRVMPDLGMIALLEPQDLKRASLEERSWDRISRWSLHHQDHVRDLIDIYFMH